MLPSWCRSVRADGPALVIAPHGGLCARDLLSPAAVSSLRGNDLHTADVAAQLAARLDASLLANVAGDRNDVDLNRIDEVLARAAWFLDAIATHLEHALARHAVVQVLIVHGWQIVQPRCDVGVGARLADGGDIAAAASRLTVSPAYAAGALETLRRATERHGIRTTYGERWPAQHRNNVMQLFRRVPRRAADGPPHALAALAAGGRVEAVQLELGAPLRWPGAWRERFLDAAAESFAVPRRAPAVTSPARATAPEGGAHAGQAAAHARASTSATATATAPPAVALQAHDARAGDAGLGVVVGLGAISPHELGARLLLFPGRQRMLLFTGHERIAEAAPGRVGGLTVTRSAHDLVIRFAGPVLDVPDASRHFQDEAAQLDARLVDLDLELHFAALGEGGYGRVTGDVRLGGAAWRIAAHGFTEPVLARGAASTGALRLTAAFGEGLGLTAELPRTASALRVRAATRAGWREQIVDGTPRPPAIAAGRLAAPFELRAHDAQTLRCTPLGHVTILRPGPGGTPLHVTFGAARYELDGQHGAGFYEHAAPAGGQRRGVDEDDRPA